MKVQLLDLKGKNCGVVNVSSKNPPGAIIYMGHFEAEYGDWNVQWIEEDEWRTKSGEYIKIYNMTKTHLEASIKMLERNNQTKTDDYKMLKQELAKRNK